MYPFNQRTSRPYATTPTTHECYQLDANDLTEYDYSAGETTLIWWNGESPATAGIAAYLRAADTDEDGQMTALQVCYRPPSWAMRQAEDDHPQASLIECRVSITYTTCNFGGSRPWFRCPAEECGHRVRKLYLPPRGEARFQCRHLLLISSLMK